MLIKKTLDDSEIQKSLSEAVIAKPEDAIIEKENINDNVNTEITNIITTNEELISKPKSKDELLLLAIEQADNATVAKLLDDGADIEVKNTENETPLIFAARNGYTDIIKELLARGANTDARNSEHLTPLMIAAVRDHSDIVKALANNGANLEAITPTGFTALMLIAITDQPNMAKILIDLGANKDTRTLNQMTPLMSAALAGNLNMVKTLLDAGADQTAKTYTGKTALMLAIETGQAGVVSALFGTEADINAAKLASKDEQWNTLYSTEIASHQENYVLTAGPHPKSFYTRQLEDITRALLQGKSFEIHQENNQTYILIDDVHLFHWTDIIAHANLEHIELNQDDFVLYQNYMQNSKRGYGGLIRCTLAKSSEDYYKEQLYSRYLAKMSNEGHTPKYPDSVISFEEMQAINIYTGEGYRNMTDLLRGVFSFNNEKPDVIKDAIIQSVLCVSGLGKVPVIDIDESYRGSRQVSNAEHLQRVQAAANHGVVPITGFISSTLDKNVAFKKDIQFHFKNLKGVDITSISQIPTEKEFLIPPTQIQLTQYEYKDGKHWFEGTTVHDLGTINEKNLLMDASELSSNETASMNDIKTRILAKKKTELIQAIIFITEASSKLSLMPENERHIEFLYLRNAVANGVAKRVSDIIKSLTDFLSLSPEACLSGSTIKDILPSIIQSTDDFKLVLKQLSPEQRTILCNAAKDVLPNIIKSTDDLGSILSLLSPEQGTLVCNTIKNVLPNIIKSYGDVESVLSHLSPEQGSRLCNAIKHVLPDMIKSIDDLRSVLNHLSLKQSLELFNSTKHFLPDIIKSVDDLRSVLVSLSPKQCSFLCRAVNNFCPDVMIQSIADFRSLVTDLSPQQSAVICHSLTDTLPNIIKSPVDFKWVLSYLSPEESWEVSKAVYKVNPNLIDYDRLAKVLEWQLTNAFPDKYRDIFNKQIPTSFNLLGSHKPHSVSLLEHIKKNLLTETPDKEKVLKVFEICNALDNNNKDELETALSKNLGMGLKTSTIHLYKQALKEINGASDADNKALSKKP